jgi:hypothetical protein
MSIPTQRGKVATANHHPFVTYLPSSFLEPAKVLHAKATHSNLLFYRAEVIDVF